MLLHAQTFTWDGGSTGPGDDNFGTAANWNPDAAPSVGSGVILRFTGSTRTTPNNNYTSGDDFGEWRLYSGAGADFTIGGNSFDLFSKIEVDSGVGRNLTLNTGAINAGANIEINPVGGNITLGSGASVELHNNRSLNVYDGNNGRTLTINGALSNGNGTGGNGQIILNQTATVILAADSDYGGTTLNSGTTLRVGTGGAAGTLGSGNTLNNGSLFVNRSTDYTYGGDLSGTGSLTKQAAGVLTLSGNNTYTGKTSITGGTISISADGKLGNAPGSAVADQLTLNGGTLKITAANQTLNANRGITLGASGGTLDTSSLANGSGNSTTFAGAITGTGALTLKANGDTSTSGGGSDTVFNLANTGNNFVGGVTITSGVVGFASDAAFGNTANVITITGGGFVATSNRTLPNTRSIVLSGGGDKIFRSYGGVTFTVNGPISGAGNVRHTDGGTLVLGGAGSFTGNVDNVAGNTTISGTMTNTGNINSTTGTLTVSGVLNNTGNVSVSGGGTMVFSGASSNGYTGYTHIQGGSTLRLDAGNLVPNGSTVLMYGGTFNVNGQSETIGSLTTGSSSDTAAAVTLGSGSLTVTSNSLPSGMTTGYGNATWHGNISGTGGVTYNQSSGTGVDWTLATTNGYSGGTSVLAGRIRAQNTGAFGSGAVTVGDGGAVYLAAGGGTFANNLSLTGRGANESGTYNGALRVAGNEDVSGQVTLNTSANQARIRNDAAVDLGSGGLVLSGKVTGSGGFEKTGPGTLRLTNTTNDFTGNITITEGHVQTNDNLQFGNASNSIVFNGGTFQQYGGAALTIGSGHTLTATAGNAIRLHVWGGGTITVNGPITGASATGLIKTDSGLLVLANSGNSYAGYTHIADASQIRLDADNVIPDTSSVLLYGGSTFNVNGRTETVAGLHVGSSGDTNAIVQLGSGANLTVTGTTMPGGAPTNIGNDFYAKITGTGNITYNHSSSSIANWYWRNTANDFTGNITITSGRLNALEASLGNAGNDLIFNGDVVSTLNNNEGKASLQVTNGTSLTLNSGRTITLNSGKEGTMYVWGSTTMQIDGQITGGGNLRKEDSGVLLLNNTSNNYTGQTKLAYGELRLGAANVLPDATTVVVGNNGVLNLNGLTDTVTSISGAGENNGYITGNGGILTVTGPGSNTYTGRVTDTIGVGNGAIVAYNGTGSLTLAGTSDNSGGRARVDAGTLILAKTSTGGVHAVGTNNTPALFINGGTVQMGGTGDDQIFTDSIVQMTGGTFDLNARAEGFRGLTGSAGTIVNNGGGASSLIIGENSVGADTYTFAGTFGTGSGVVNLTKRGGGTQILTGTSPFTGSVTVMDGGTLSVPSIAATGVSQPLGAGSSAINLSQGSTLAVTGGGSTNRGLSLTTTGGKLDVASATTVTITGGITGDTNSADFTKSGAGTFNQSGSGNWTGNAFITGGTYNVTSGGSINSSGIVTLTGSSTLNIGSATQVRASSLNITAGTVNFNAGTLRTNGITVAGGSAFTWGATTLTVQTAASGNSGTTDRTGPGGAPSGPTIKEGTILNVTATAFSTGVGSTINLGSMYLSGSLRYDQLKVSGSLNIAADSTLQVGLNPYFLRPSSPNDIDVGDWGTLRLVMADTITGTFTLAGISSDSIGWRELGSQVGDPAFSTAAALPLNTYYVEYATSGIAGEEIQAGAAILFHYHVSGSVPEPASAGLLVAGAMILRAVARRKS